MISRYSPTGPGRSPPARRPGPGSRRHPWRFHAVGHGDQDLLGACEAKLLAYVRIEREHA